MSVSLLSVPLENVSPPIYVLPSTQQIRVTPCKRGREDENDGVSVVESVKRIKPLDTVGSWESTPRAIKDARKLSLLEARGPPSIHNASEYLDAMFGYDSQTEKHYEYGSDTDEEDPPSDTDEPMLSADDDAPPSPHQPMTDISEEAFRAEIDQLFVGSDELVKTFFSVDSDSDGEDSGEESELDVAVGGRVTEWAKPGPSPLRREMDLSPQRPRKLTLIPRKEKKRRVLPIVRSSRHTQGVDRENVHRDALGRCQFRSLSLPSVEYGPPLTDSDKVLGKKKVPAPAHDNVIPSHSPDSKQKGGMGRGTPSRFGRWTPLTPPASPYAYSTPDDTVPFERFGPPAFHGRDAWGTLFRSVRRSTQGADAQSWEGYAGPVRHLLLVGVGPTRRAVEMRADMRAMQLLRAHGVELASMPGRVPKGDVKGVTTGMILEEAARVKALMGRAGAPSPEQQLVDEDVPMDMVLFDEDDVEELGPWLPWTPGFGASGSRV